VRAASVSASADWVSWAAFYLLTFPCPFLTCSSFIPPGWFSSLLFSFSLLIVTVVFLGFFSGEW